MWYSYIKERERNKNKISHLRGLRNNQKSNFLTSSIQKIKAILKCSTSRKGAVNLTGKEASPMACDPISSMKSLSSDGFAVLKRLF